MTDSWNAHRAEIEQLYIQENRTLKYIAEFMASKGFRKTKSQYETQFKKWGLRKKQTVPRNANWDFIARRVEKRKRLHGKESEVVIDEETVPPEKVRKLQYGKTFVSTAARFSGYGAPSPKTPEGIVVRTPPSSIARVADQEWYGGLSLTWNPSLPWLRFVRLLCFNQNQDRPALSSVISIPPSSEVCVQPDVKKIQLMQRLKHTFPFESRSQLLHMDFDSRIRAMLTVLMPEEYEGQHQLMQTNRLSTELYMLSNNLESHDGLGSFKEHNERVLAMIRNFGWHKGCQFKTLLGSQEPTVEAIVEKIFASAVCEVDIEVMKLILEAGRDPNSLVDSKISLLTPLQWAATATDSRGAEMAELLISHKADIQLIQSGGSALGMAIAGRNHWVIEVLLRHNAVVDIQCLAEATRTVDANLFERLLNSCPDIKRLGYNELQGNVNSLLFSAISANKEKLIKVLLRHNAASSLRCLEEATRTVDANLFATLWKSCPDVYGLIYNADIADTKFGTQHGKITLLGAAAKSGRLEIIETILRVCPGLVNPRGLEATGGANYVSPISLAIENNHTEALKVLLDAGVDINFVNGHEQPPIERALARHNFRAYEILVESGATITRPLSYQKLRVLMRTISGEEDCVSTMKQLINESAQLSHNVTEWSGEVLVEAIKNNDLLVIGLLLDSGATVAAEKLTSVGNQETAQYLDTRGVLQAILDENGRQVFCTVMNERDWDMAQWLLIRAPILLNESLYSGLSPLCSAAKSKKPGLIKFMLESGARVTDHVLCMAIAWMQYCQSRSDEAFKVLRLLLSHFKGPAPNAIAMATRVYFGNFRIDDSTGQDTDVLQLLLSEGVEPTGTLREVFGEDWDDPAKPQSALELVVKDRNRSALDILTQPHYHWGAQALGRSLAVACTLSGEDFVDSILQRNPRMNEYVCTGFRYGYLNVSTALQVAVREQKVSVVRKLLGFADTDINCAATGPRGRTALQHAVENGNLELITMLLNHDADVNSPPAEDGGATTLQLAAIKGYIGIARHLLDIGADVNSPGAVTEGRTALEGAAEHGRVDMVHMLLDEGAWIFGDAGEKQYKNAVSLARKHGHYAVARMLERFKSRAEQVHGHISSIAVDGGGGVYEEEHSMI